MGSVYRKRGSKWYLHFKNADGQWVDRATNASNKTQATRLLADIEHKADRQRHGLEEMPDPNGGGSVAELMTWWLDHYSRHTSSHARNTSVVVRHFIEAPIGKLTLAQFSSARLGNSFRQNVTMWVPNR